ncbi:MAG: hypothetical protein RR543_01465 [Erysipelotrichales bacterium]
MNESNLMPKDKRVRVFLRTQKKGNKPKQTKTELYSNINDVDFSKYKQRTFKSIIVRENDIKITFNTKER